MRKTLHTILFFVSFHMLFAQEYSAKRYPFHFNQFFESTYLYNPAINGTYQHGIGKIGYLGHPGVFKKIRSFYAAIYGKLPKKHGKSSQFLGGYVLNDQEGLLLQRTQVYLNYAWQTHLNKDLKLSAGTSLGVNSFLISGKTASTKGSDIHPDGSIGLWLAHEKYYFGLSSNQIFQSKLQPLQETFLLKRTYQINGGIQVLNKKKINLFIHSQFRQLDNQLYDIDIALLANCWESVYIGLSSYFQRNIGFLIGLQQRIDQGYLIGFLSYHIPATQNHSQINTFEITIALLKEKRTIF